ncbi:Txe/YoeB family addiction module toxin [Agromyces sp. NPDC058484]|uniref:Txe/YoeB family addiction module toxin n=1 Tax=Agromyces sp. NPDC058484 TaxID=3346524 RepID=UPI003665AA40
MRLVFTDRGWDDYQWLQANDRRLLRRTDDLIKAALREPFSGIGKPERLRYGLADTWSRRIDQEHRLVYRVLGDDLVILAARFHFE